MLIKASINNKWKRENVLSSVGFADIIVNLERRKGMLNKFRKSEKGFTLIELLIVVAIIGILAAIAIPQFAAYRQKAYNSASQSDIRNMKTGMESYYADNQQYPEYQ